MSNETIKRQQQPLEVFEPAIPPLDPELLFKDPLKHKESEQEQEWKMRQVKPCWVKKLTLLANIHPLPCYSLLFPVTDSRQICFVTHYDIHGCSTKKKRLSAMPRSQSKPITTGLHLTQDFSTNESSRPTGNGCKAGGMWELLLFFFKTPSKCQHILVAAGCFQKKFSRKASNDVKRLFTSWLIRSQLGGGAVQK